MQSLLERTEPMGECLIWTGASKTASGYGVAVYRGKQTTAHRIMYMLSNNLTMLGKNVEIDHMCNNRACINPDHLQLVTHAENMYLAVSRRSTCKAGHEWNDKNTYTTKVKRKQGGYRMQRYCRVCRAKHQADLRERRT